METEPELPPTLVLSPPDDDEFRSLALSAIDHGSRTPMALQNVLRRTYPGAVVRPRELAGERAEVWYVYRDGRWVRPGT
jgi:hypothetical protein